jgi:N-acetylmuramoyl-L-alanine amidase
MTGTTWVAVAVGACLTASLGLAAAGSEASAQTGTKIMVSGEAFDVGRPVVLWTDKGGFNAYATGCVENQTGGCCGTEARRYGARRLSGPGLPALQARVQKVVLHFDGCVNARSCFKTMHNEVRPSGACGMSTHFMIDADGTIYQTLDVVESAFHAEQENSTSVGIELTNRGDASRNELARLPRDYSTRRVKDVRINGRDYKGFDFRPEQYDAVRALVRTLLRALPAIKPIYPVGSDGEPLMETLRDPGSFQGIVGHFHVDKQRQKWDPGAFDWAALDPVLSGLYFPVSLRGHGLLPTTPEELRRASTIYYRNAEERATGFFPIAPSGLWHSGIHLRTVEGAHVVAPLRGRIVAARLGQRDGSSTGMVLIRHRVSLTSGGVFDFFSLLAHLGLQDIARSEVPWVRSVSRSNDKTATAALQQGTLALVDLPVEPGEVVGSVGPVKRGAEQGAELHFEMFSVERPPESLDLRTIGAAADGMLVGRRGILSLVDENGDNRMPAAEVERFFRHGDPAKKEALRGVVIQHVHEWADRMSDPDDAAGPLLAQQLRERLQQLRRKNFDPYVFWTGALSSHAGLPANKVIYSCHPITLLTALAANLQRLVLRRPASVTIDTSDAVPALPYLEDWEPRIPSQELFGPLKGRRGR